MILAALVGCVVGPFGAMFGLALNKATALRTADPRLIYLRRWAAWSSCSCTSISTLMAAAPPTKFLSRCGSISRFPCVPPRSSFVTTIITHLFGGSSGREGAAPAAGGFTVRADRQETAAGGPGTAA